MKIQNKRLYKKDCKAGERQKQHILYCIQLRIKKSAQESTLALHMYTVVRMASIMVVLSTQN